MKRLPLILSATALALALGATAAAQAPVTIYIAGANADRATTNTAVPKLLTGTLTFAGSNADPTRANFATWTGGSFNGTPVTVKASYLGATAGIAAVAGNLQIRFLPNGATGGTNPDPTVGSNPNESAVPDIAMSSQSQASTPFIGSYQGRIYEDLTPYDNIVSVLGFRFIASKGFPGDNITSQAAQLLYQNGAAPLATFTQNPLDKNKTVFATGRNLDSGARYVSMSEVGVGLFSIVKHFRPTITGASGGVGGTVASHELWPRETVSGVDSVFPGNSGANTGTGLAGFLTATLSEAAYKVGNPNATAGYYVGYLSTQDTDNIAVPNGGVALKFNGVPYSEEAVREGRYTLWSYEHLYYNSATATGGGLKKTFADALANQIKSVDANISGIFVDTMNVSRQIEGGLVSPNYF